MQKTKQMKPVLTETILRNKLTPFSEYASITPEAAALLVREGHGDKLLQGNSGLTGLTSLSAGEAKYFSQHHGDLELNGVTEISDSAAASFAKHEGRLELRGLTQLSDAAAESLGKHKGELSLDGVTSLSDAAAKSFSRHKGSLYLNGLTELSDAAAESLSKHEGDLGLSGLTKLSDAAAESLSRKLANQLILPSSLAARVQTARKKTDKKSVLNRSQETKIRKLLKTKETSNLLMVCELLETVGANDEEWCSVFSLYRLKVLLNTWDPEIWDSLATAMKDRLSAFEVLIEAASGRFRTFYHRLHPDHFEFITNFVETGRKETIELLDFAIASRFTLHNEVKIKSTSLSDQAADILSRVQFSFTVDHLKELADTPGHVALAERLAKDDHRRFDALNSLSDAAAESFAKYKGGLSFGGLTELSDAAAESFSKCGEFLSLNGLTQLSDAAAESLSKHKGGLYLDGLTSLSDATAESFSKHTGDLCLGLTTLSDAAAESLSKCQNISLMSLSTLSDSAAESFSKYKGDLNLYGLTSLSDAAAESLSKHEGGLSLDGLTSLSDAAAESLSKHKCHLSLNGLASLSDAAAESLSKHKEKLGLNFDQLPESTADIFRSFGAQDFG